MSSTAHRQPSVGDYNRFRRAEQSARAADAAARQPKSVIDDAALERTGLKFDADALGEHADRLFQQPAGESRSFGGPGVHVRLAPMVVAS